MGTLQMRRVYEESGENDGCRILVDRLWPRGISKEKAKLDLWAKNIAPSAGLRKWYGHDPEKYPEFCEKYREELSQNPGWADFRKYVSDQLADGNVTLLYGARTGEISNASVLLRLLHA